MNALAFCSRPQIHGAVLGYAEAGHPNKINHPSPNVVWHERIHERLISLTTVGFAARCCGMVRLYGVAGEPRREPALRYLRAYYAATGSIQEAAATAAEMFVGLKTGGPYASFEEICSTRPPVYVLGGLQLLEVGKKIIESADLSGMEYVRCCGIAPLAVAIAAMSPPMTEAEILCALAPARRTWMAPLSAVRSRYVRLRDFLHNAPLELLEPIAREASVPKIGQALKVAAGLCTAANLPWSTLAGTEREFTEKHLGKFAKHIGMLRLENRTPDELRDAERFFEIPLIQPRHGQQWLIGTMQQVKPLLTQIGILEATADESGPYIVVHAFDADGNHAKTLRIDGQPPEKTLAELAKQLLEHSDGHCSGVVTAPETEASNLGDLLKPYRVVYTPLGGQSAETLEKRKIIGRCGDVLLLRMEPKMGGVLWHVAPYAGEANVAELGLWDRCYCWVLRNGAAAMVRWGNYYQQDSDIPS